MHLLATVKVHFTLDTAEVHSRIAALHTSHSNSSIVQQYSQRCPVELRHKVGPSAMPDKPPAITGYLCESLWVSNKPHYKCLTVA